MAELRAAGLVVFRRVTDIQFLLLKASYPPFHWTPPKGHVDPGENDRETALRETQEEAGLSPSHLNITSFSKTLNYKVRERPKSVIYWLAELSDAQFEVQLSDEHTHFEWLGLTEACVRVEYPEMQQLLSQCEQFIQTNL